MMKTIGLIVVTALLAPAPSAKSPKSPVTPSADAMVYMNLAPPEPWVPQDAADSLYRAARDALSKGDNSRAADLFNQVVQKYPSSTYAGESLYYYAFSLYRVGGTQKLKAARSALGRLSSSYPSVARRGDATTLRTRVCGELARTGDESCAAEVAATARSISSSSSSSSSSSGAGYSSSGSSSGSSSASAPVSGCPGSGDDDDERVAALNALLQMDADQALPILTKVLERRDRCSAPLRRKAVFLVSQKHNAQTADLLMSVARNDPDQETRDQAVFWLGQVPDERAVDLLEQILRTSNDEDTQNKAIFAISQHSSGRGASILRDVAMREGASAELRGQAIFWLGQRPTAENNEFLRGLFSKITSEELKDKILFSLSQRKGQGNDKWLMDIALGAHESIDIRKKALFWAAQSGVSVDEITPLYSRITDKEMKDQVIFVLSQRNTPAAVDMLIQIAKTDRDPEMRKKAIFWLGQSRDPRVQRFLIDLINK